MGGGDSVKLKPGNTDAARAFGWRLLAVRQRPWASSNLMIGRHPVPYRTRSGGHGGRLGRKTIGSSVA